MLVSNVAAEIELNDRWSLCLPVYYSAMNYFTYGIKFRTFTVQPEARYHFNNGLFVGGHLGLTFFNLAINGSYRFQDHNRHSPALGGGIALGYRRPLKQDTPWWIEFAIGSGIYHLYYDKFINEPNGRLVDTRKKTFFGIDQVSVAIAYRFDIRKKGGHR